MRHARVRRLSGRALTAAALAAPALGAFAATPPTDFEQYALELINRARLDPPREVYRFRNEAWGNTGSPRGADLMEGGVAFIFPGPKEPLAFNTNLTQSARDYSNTLLINNAFPSTFGGTSPPSRAAANGFITTRPFSETLAVSPSGAAYPISQAVVDLHQVQTFVDANHVSRTNRLNILGLGFKEIGIGFAQRNGYVSPGQNAVLSTYDFGSQGTSQAILT